MLRSFDLRAKIKRADAMLEMMKSAGWENFLEDFIQPMQDRLFEEWKKTPAEKTIAILELQMQGKFSDIILKYQKTVSDNLNAWMSDLKLILEGEEEDTVIQD